MKRLNGFWRSVKIGSENQRFMVMTRLVIWLTKPQSHLPKPRSEACRESAALTYPGAQMIDGAFHV
jgi:hypothetical protein